MQILNDYFMVLVDQLYETSVTDEGIITLAASWVNSQAEERYIHKRIYGDVIGVPRNFTDTKYDVIDHGYPDPKMHISGELIQNYINAGYKHYDRQSYSVAGCDGFEPLTLADWAKNTDIQLGDKVYFDPRVTEPHNMLGVFQKKQFFKVRVDEIMCVVRRDELIMQGDWCLTEPIEESWESIRTASGLYKKPHPDKVYMQGKLKHFRNRTDVQKNDIIIHRPGMDWRLKVQGKEYYAIQNVDIIAKLQKQ